jgi:thioredoxin-like negative regulator of GroEL
MKIVANQSAPDSPLPASPASWVICLCADWCGLCRDYQQVFAQVQARYPLSRFVWLDIEDQADLVGDIDVETFPTVLIADGLDVRFFGPLTPQLETLSRLLDALAQAGSQATPTTLNTLATQQLLQAVITRWQTGPAKSP